MADAGHIQRPNAWTLSGNGPLYLQLRQRLEEEIRNGALRPGAPLPSEREIAEICGISRVTVRKAVQSLVRDGFVIQGVVPARRSQGRSTGSSSRSPV